MSCEPIIAVIDHVAAPNTREDLSSGANVSSPVPVVCDSLIGSLTAYSSSRYVMGFRCLESTDGGMYRHNDLELNERWKGEKMRTEWVVSDRVI